MKKLANTSYRYISLLILSLTMLISSLVTPICLSQVVYAGPMALYLHDATNITSADATLNCTATAFDSVSDFFWVSTAPFVIYDDTPTEKTPTVIPSGVYSTSDLGPVTSGNNFSAKLSSVNGLPTITPSTTYYFAAWVNVGDQEYPHWVASGGNTSFTTASAPVVAPAPKASTPTASSTPISNAKQVATTAPTTTDASSTPEKTTTPSSNPSVLGDTTTAPVTKLATIAKDVPKTNNVLPWAIGGGAGVIIVATASAFFIIRKRRAKL
jgi:hypothetical protein